MTMDLYDGLEPDVADCLRQWADLHKRDYELGRWLVNGRSKQPVAIVCESDQRTRRARILVVKVLSAHDDSVVNLEYARHFEAIDQSPDFAAKHLSTFVYDAIPAPRGQWITFQTVVGGDWRNTHVLTVLLRRMLAIHDEYEPSGIDRIDCSAEVFVAACRAVVGAVLREWAGPPFLPPAKVKWTVAEFFHRHLFEQLTPGDRLGDWSARFPDEHLVDDQGERLCNPFAVARGEWLGDVTLRPLIGCTHGDLHADNALLTVHPVIDYERFYLIDTALYEKEAPVTRDPVHFVLYILARSLETIPGTIEREALIELLLDPSGAPIHLLPGWLSALIRQIDEEVRAWLGNTGLNSIWDDQYELSLAACAMLFLGRTSTRHEDKPWFLRLAAVAVTRFSDRVRPQTSEVVRPPVVTPATTRADVPPPESSAPYFVGRQSELREFSDFHAGNTPYRVDQLFGPGGIGKTAMFREFVRSGVQQGTVVGYADVAEIRYSGIVPSFRPADILRGLAGTISRPELDAFRNDLLDYDLITDLERTEGGAGALFGPNGRPRPETRLVEVIDNGSPRLREILRSRFAFDRYLRAAQTGLTQAFCDGLGAITEAGTAALLLDTYEEIGGLDDWVCREVMLRLPERTRLVILGRHKLTTNIDWMNHEHDLRMREVLELSESEAKSYLRHYGLSDSAGLDAIYKVTGGYPLLLVLVRALSVEAGGWEHIGELQHGRDKDAIARGLLDRILREERVRNIHEVIEKCCIAPWIDPGVIGAVLDVSAADAHGLYTELAAHSFVTRHPRGVTMHDKIKELLRASLAFADPDGYQELTARLTRYLGERAGISDA
ncbi:hypothetical protein ABZ319_28945 [Nocardia sp. NPDC005978]|uniref:hypothetical protein n=1 Tax=Nocardia sp. NPDC005978 TaxID=3156725 RepID=UPI0033B7A189